MITWPSFPRKAPQDAEQVASPLEPGTAGPPPAVDAPRKGIGENTAPAIPAPATPAAAPLHGKTFTGGVVLALGASILAHGAMIAFVVDRLKAEGMEAASDAISVELIFDAPPEMPPEPVASPESETPDPQPEAEDTFDREPDRNSDLAEPPESAPAEAPPPATDAAAQEAPPAEREPPIEQVERQSDENAAPSLTTLPEDAVPVPTPRPEPPVASAPQKAASENASDKPAQQRKAAQQNTRNITPPVQQAGRKGGATRGDIATYRRRILSHLERHKRYPREAQRQNITGTANLRITFDRHGRLVAARLSKGSGHAVLDEEALATARRAAPYPKPPEGIGDDTNSVTVRLDYGH